jgi:hypothetical protein
MLELPRWQNVQTSVSGSTSSDAEPQSTTGIKSMQSSIIKSSLLNRTFFYVQISQHRGRDPAEQSLAGLKEKHRVGDAEFLVDG